MPATRRTILDDLIRGPRDTHVCECPGHFFFLPFATIVSSLVCRVPFISFSLSHPIPWISDALRYRRIGQRFFPRYLDVFRDCSVNWRTMRGSLKLNWTWLKDWVRCVCSSNAPFIENYSVRDRGKESFKVFGHSCTSFYCSYLWSSFLFFSFFFCMLPVVKGKNLKAIYVM